MSNPRRSSFIEFPIVSSVVMMAKLYIVSFFKSFSHGSQHFLPFRAFMRRGGLESVVCIHVFSLSNIRRIADISQGLVDHKPNLIQFGMNGRILWRLCVVLALLQTSAGAIVSLCVRLLWILPLVWVVWCPLLVSSQTPRGRSRVFL